MLYFVILLVVGYQLLTHGFVIIGGFLVAAAVAYLLLPAIIPDLRG